MSEPVTEILIVEDSPTQALRLQHILERQGYHVTHAPDGRQALEAVRARTPALVVSDVVMPEMDGYELCRRLKDDPTLGAVPVILVTTLSDPADVIRGLECRADNFILKPYDERYLLSRIQYVLVNREMRDVERTGVAVQVFFNGERHTITADRLQILNLLLSTYEAAIQRNKDLTRAQESLLEIEERTRQIITTAHDAFIGIDEAGAIVEWNLAAVEMFGWSRAEAVGQQLSAMIIPPQYREAHEAGLARLIRTGKGAILNTRIELTALRRDRTEFPIELIVWSIQAGGKRTFNAFIRDITEQKRVDAAIRAAKDEAERANRAKSEFLSRMSHDLRTPLNAILGFAQLLEMDPLSAEQQESIRHILKGGAHLLDLINEVLDIARIESGRLSLSTEPVPIGDLIQHVIDMVRPLGAVRNIGFENEAAVSCGDRHVLADRPRLRQILVNLLSNAVKYNRDGGRVRVTCEVSDGRVRINVSDTGPGIRPEKLSLLFQPFERLGAEQTAVEGTGLGLVLSKGLAEAMDGTVGVRSDVDRGSTFWIDLPLAETGPTAGPSPTPQPPVAASADSWVTGTVVYIEDNISNHRLMERVLARRPGVRLIGASEGQKGIDLVRTVLPDLILLDLHLPDMQGEDVLERLWADSRTRSIPVAVLSADATLSRTNRVLATGATAYLPKPIDIAAVLRLVDELLGKPR